MEPRRDTPGDHNSPEYTRRLEADAWWRRVLRDTVYGRNIRRVVSGRVLDVGCGVGRLHPWLGDRPVGIATNTHSVASAVARGYLAFTPEDFTGSDLAGPASYQTLLMSHVLEHMTNQEASDLVAHYVYYLEPGGRVVVIVPQEAGFASDPTHVDPVDIAEIETIAEANRLEVSLTYSYPFPRFAGRLFRHNETVAILRKPG